MECVEEIGQNIKFYVSVILGEMRWDGLIILKEIGNMKFLGQEDSLLVLVHNLRRVKVVANVKTHPNQLYPYTH